MKIKLIFSYDGSRFQGSATQPHANSVQDTLLNALTHLGIFERPLFASRTDKGVHSLGAVASVRCGEHFDDLNLLKNQLQPSIIADNVSGVRCLAFLRNHKSYDSTAFLQSCFGRGNYFLEPVATNLKSYDSSSVLGLVFVDYKNWDFKRSEVVLIHNDGSKENPRSKLSLFWLKDEEKGEFVKLFTLDEGLEVSYPALLAQDKSLKSTTNKPNDKLYLSYTLDRKHIKMQILSVKAIEKAIDEKRVER